MKRKEIAKKLGITILALMLTVPVTVPAVHLVQAAPADTKDADAVPADTKDADAVPADTKDADAVPADTKDADAADTKDTDTAPADTKDADAVPADTKDTVPADSENTDTAPAASGDTDGESETKGLKFTTKTYEKVYKTQDGTVYKEISFEYPYAEGDQKAAQTLNSFYQKLLKKWKKQAKKDLKEAEEMAAQTESMDHHYTDEVTCEITAQDENYISVLLSGYEYTMGAHGLPYRYTYIFDAKTGKKVSAASLLGMSKKQLNTKVRRLYLKKFDQTQKEESYLFYPDREAVKTTLNRLDFNDNQYYLKNGKVRFYAYPYDLGPYAAGFIEVAVKL